jgi:DNA-binding NarL/FixJ family response regulator
LPHLAATYFLTNINHSQYLLRLRAGSASRVSLEWTRPDETIASLTTTLRSLPVIVLSDLDGADSMMAAFEAARVAIFPTGSMTVAIAAIRLLRAGGIFVSPSSLKMINYPLSTRDSTPQGKSNEVVLDEIQMSESTIMGLSATL